MCEVCEEGLAIQGRDVRNVRFLHGRVGGRGGKEWRRKTRLSKTRHGRGAKLWRFEGGGSGSDAPAHTDPQDVPCLPFRPVNHCPFKHHVVPPIRPPPCPPASPGPLPHFLRLPHSNGPPQQPTHQRPFITSRLLPITAPFLHFSSLLPSLLLTSNSSNPRPNPPGTLPPPLPHPLLGGGSRRRRTHRPGSGLDSPYPGLAGAEAAAAKG